MTRPRSRRRPGEASASQGGPILKYEGVVIRRTALPRGDVIATLLTSSGKVKVVARNGAKGSRGRLLSLFNYVLVMGSQGAGRDMVNVSDASLQGALTELTDPLRFAAAALLCELTDQLVQEGDEGGPWAEHVFELLASALRGSNRAEHPGRLAWVMAWKLLAHAGFPLRIPLDGEPRRGVWAEARASEMLTAVHRQSVRRVLEGEWPGAGVQWRLWRVLRVHLERQGIKLRSWEVLWPMLELELGARDPGGPTEALLDDRPPPEAAEEAED